MINDMTERNPTSKAAMPMPRPPELSPVSPADLATQRELFFGENVAFAIMVLSNMIARNTTARVLASAELTLHEWRTVRLVQIFGPLNAVDIIDTLAMDKTTVSRIITSLYQRGFLELHPNPSDRRHTLISVTPAGAGKISSILAADEEADASYERHLTASEKRQLSKLLLKLYRGSKQSYDELIQTSRKRRRRD